MPPLDYSNLSMNYAQVKIWSRKATKKNPFNFVVAFICSSEDLGTWHRSMDHRGINASTTLAQRPFTDVERERMAKCTRLYWLHYKDWYTLILDEYLETKNLDWMQELIKVSRQQISAEKIVIAALMGK